jgi:hypothetical protein
MAEKKADSNKKKGEAKTDETPTALIESESKHDGNPKPGEGAKSATSNAAPTEQEPPRAQSQTIAMPLNAAVGAPPAIPAASAVEDPASLPGPKDIPAGDPTTPAPPPSKVPPGDSRSLRRGTDFALIYRQQTHVITRIGTVGQRGTWRVVEYPTVAMAATSYARECSKFVADGFSDYR